MTKLLDLLENYLQWRWTTPDGQDLKYCRIDGNTSLEQREIAINDFNAPHSDKFIFLLSIRAAGRGLNLQTADTVVVYDPDPNPKNEEQAIARAHRIGQTREVRVIHFEAVDDDIVQKKKGSKKEEVGWGGPNRSYCESLESSVRNVIQKQKIEMAAEIVDAGRFDGQTTHAERRETLENLLQQQANGTRTGVSVPPLKELNGKIARSQEEWDLFNRLDEELDWPGALLSSAECPSWIKYTQDEIDQAVFANTKVGQSSVTQFNENMGRGARSTNNLNASGSAVWTHADRQEGDFIDRTGIADDDGDEDEESDDVAVREDSIEDIGDIDIDDIEDAEDDDDTTTLNTVEMNDADEDDGGESPKRRRLEY
jgi:SWI/SNF-related matrix-associated actin-dependent regulator of chromatin subfamily A protein 2/4